MTAEVPGARMPDPLAGGATGQLWTGVKAAFAGFSWIRRDRHVAMWTAGAIVVYLGLWVGAMMLAAQWDDRLIGMALWPRGPAWWQSALYEVARFFLYALFWLSAVLLTFVLALPAVSPLFAFVAESAEDAYFGVRVAHASTIRELIVELLKSVGRSLLLVAIHLAGSATIWLLGFGFGLLFPPAASVVSFVLGGAWSAMWIALATMSWVLENNRAPLAQQLRMVADQPALMLGFGVVSQPLTWVPLTAPIVVVSSTVLVCRLYEHGHCDLPLRARASPPIGSVDDTA